MYVKSLEAKTLIQRLYTFSQANPTRSFFVGLCQWNDTSTGVYDWARQRGSTATINTGPSSDHTKGNLFVYLSVVSPMWSSSEMNGEIFSCSEKVQGDELGVPLFKFFKNDCEKCFGDSADN